MLKIKTMFRVKYFRLHIVICALVFYCSLVNAESKSEILPGHVFQKAQILDNKINRLALLMGIEFKKYPSITLSAAHPRDVFYQGLTLHKKAGRIRYEFTRMEPEVLKFGDYEYQPTHVFKLIIKTENLIDDVLNNIYESNQIIEADILDLNDYSKSVSPTVDLKRQPKDVFVTLVAINRKLNQLLDFNFSPADTFEQATLAISYASAILQTLPQEPTIYEPNPLVVGKKPSDVYQLISTVHQKLYECLEGVDVTINRIPEEVYLSSEIGPSDVYDLTNLVVSNLAFLHRNLKTQVKPRPTYYPGKTVPSVVYQRVTILEKQISAIHRLRHQLEMK